MSKKPKKAVIISKDFGASGRPLTSAIPKSLLPLGTSTLLEIQLTRLSKAGFNDVIYFTNYKKDYIERFLGSGSDYGVRLSVRKEADETGSAAILASIADELGEAPFLGLNGDILTLFDYNKLYKYGCAQESPFTAGVRRVVASSTFANVVIDGDNITAIMASPDRVSYILAGMYVFKPEALASFATSEAPLMEGFLREATGKGQAVRKFEVDDYWLDVGSIDDLEKAQMDYAYYSTGADRRSDAL